MTTVNKCSPGREVVQSSSIRLAAVVGNVEGLIIASTCTLNGGDPMKVLFAIIFTATATLLGAQQDSHTTSTSPSAMQHAEMPDGAAHKEMMQMMQKMEQQMKAAPMTGNADIDFANMMIPHHQGAVDMAKWQLKHGKDEKLRDMAEKIVESQEKEITEMRARIQELQKNPRGDKSKPSSDASKDHH
jgi:hypothetical protein